MNSSTTPINPLYLEFRRNGAFQLLLFGMAILLGAIAAVGIILNATVCYISIKYRYQHSIFRSKTGILIALDCFFEVLHQTSHIIYLGNVLSKGTDFIPFQSAILIQAHTLVGISGAICMLLSLSADRLLAVIAPIFYRNVERRSYLMAHLLVIFSFACYYFYVMIRAAIQYPDWMVTGALGDFFSVPGIGMSIYFLNVAIMCIAICSYFFVAIIANCKIDVNNEHLRKLFRSIFLIVCINIGGYFLCNLLVALVLLSILNPSPFQFWFLNNLASIGLNIAAASNAPILFFNSSEYHEAYSKEFDWIKCAFLKLIGKNQIHPQNSTMVEVTTKQPRSLSMKPQLPTILG